MWGGRKAAEQEQVIVGREAWLMEVGGEGGEAKGQRKSGLREGRFEEAGSSGLSNHSSTFYLSKSPYLGFYSNGII